VVPVVKLVNHSARTQVELTEGTRFEAVTDGEPAAELRHAEETAVQLRQQAETEAEAILAQARRESDSWLAEAGRQAELIVQDAELQAETILTNARISGHEQGFAEGLAEAQNQYRSKIDAFLATMRQIEADRKKRLLQSEQQIVELSLAIAGRIIEKQLETDNQWIVNTVKSALAEAVDRSRIEILAHPEDIPILVLAKEEFLSSIAAKAELHFVSEPSIRQGGCVLHTPQGTIDARLDTQLNEVKRALLEVAATLQT
jgi:flagellar assembly protein FliH